MKERTPDEIRNEAMCEFIKMAPAKYNQGQKEHGGNLDKKGLLNLIRESKMECIDNWFYLCSVEYEAMRMQGMVKDAELKRKNADYEGSQQ